FGPWPHQAVLLHPHVVAFYAITREKEALDKLLDAHQPRQRRNIVSAPFCAEQPLRFGRLTGNQRAFKRRRIGMRQSHKTQRRHYSPSHVAPLKARPACSCCSISRANSSRARISSGTAYSANPAASDAHSAASTRTRFSSTKEPSPAAPLSAHLRSRRRALC